MTSTTIRVHKAGPLADSQVPGVQILIEEEMPRSPTLDEQRLAYRDEARILARALRGSLPGGTVDRLTGELLLMKASDFIVSHDRLMVGLSPAGRDMDGVAARLLESFGLDPRLQGEGGKQLALELSAALAAAYVAGQESSRPVIG